MPFAVGSAWTYDVESEGNSLTSSETIELTTTVDYGGESYYESWRYLFRDTDSALVIRGDEGERPVVFYYPDTGLRERTIEEVTPFGDTWYAEVRLKSENTPISVPVGTFDTVVYEVISGYRNRSDTRDSTRYHFAYGIGLVYEKRTSVSGEVSTRQLREYVLAQEPGREVVFEQEPRFELATGTRAFVSWATQAPRSGTVRYGKQGGAITDEVSFIQAVGDRTATLTGLEPGATYDFVLSFDIGEDMVQSETYSFRTIEQSTQVVSDLQTYQRRIIGDLTGENELAGSVRLGARADSASRALASDYLVNELASLGLEPKRHEYILDWSSSGSQRGTNPYAIIPATVDTDEYVVVGAHYDSEYESPGAGDNATGVALVLGAAQEVMAMSHRTKNLMVVFFDQEEQGLIGSFAFADSLKRVGTNLHSAHTMDLLGWDSDGDRAIEIEIPPPSLEFLYRAAAAESSGVPVHTTGVGSTDFFMFKNRGFDALGVSEEYVNGDTTPHIHQPTDTYDTVNFDYLEETTRLISYTWRLLLSQEPPQPES